MKTKDSTKTTLPSHLSSSQAHLYSFIPFWAAEEDGEWWLQSVNNSSSLSLLPPHSAPYSHIGSPPWQKEQPVPPRVPHRVRSPVGKPAPASAPLHRPQILTGTYSDVDCPCTTAFSKAHPPTEVWGARGATGGYLLQCCPPCWKGISPGAPPALLFALALVSAVQFLSHFSHYSQLPSSIFPLLTQAKWRWWVHWSWEELVVPGMGKPHPLLPKGCPTPPAASTWVPAPNTLVFYKLLESQGEIWAVTCTNPSTVKSTHQVQHCCIFIACVDFRLCDAGEKPVAEGHLFLNWDHCINIVSAKLTV